MRRTTVAGRCAKGLSSVLALVLVLGVGASRSDAATTWVVDPGGGGDFTTIQDAINAAVDGDTIDVRAATYLEQIDLLGKDIVLESVDGAGLAILDGQNTNGPLVSCVSQEPPTTVIDGFVFQNASSTVDGGGARVVNSAPTFRHCSFLNDTTTGDGGGAFVEGARVGATSFEDCLFQGNEVADAAGGGLCGRTTNVTLLRCDFLSNHATGGGQGFAVGGGAAVVGEAEGYVEACRFDGNTAGDFGGGLEFETGAVDVVNSVFRANSAATAGGGISSRYYSLNDVINCSFSLNQAPAGAGIFATGMSEVDVGNSILYGDLGAELDDDSTAGTVLADASDVQGGYAGTGNQDVDPLFTDTLLHIPPGSPAVDAGDDLLVPIGITTDKDGNLRFVGAAVDQGAYEVTMVPPPTVTASVLRPLLWVPFWGLIPVGFRYTASTPCNGGIVSTTVYVYENEDAAAAPDLTPDAAYDAAGLRLRFERVWPSPGRVYLIVVEVTDACGGVARAAVTVVVPTNMTLSSILRAFAAAKDAQTYVEDPVNDAEPPPGYVLVESFPLY